MTLFILALFVVLVYLCIYSIVDRICKCVENKHMAEAYSEYMVAIVNDRRTENANHFAIGFREAIDAFKNKDKKDVTENQNNN